MGTSASGEPGRRNGMATVKPALNGKVLQTGVSAENTSGVDTGLVFERYFTDGKISPFENVEWEKRTALIGNEKGVTIFRQEGVEVPKSWSQTATNIVTSKYFHGKPGTPRARKLGAPADQPRGEHHRPLGRRRRILRRCRIA